jgi:hypothetical protein
MFEGKDRWDKMKIPHENGGDSLTLKTTNIREIILSVNRTMDKKKWFNIF